MQVTMFPIRRHSPSNLHVFVSHRNRSVSRSSKPGGSKETLINGPHQLSNTDLRSAGLEGYLMSHGSRRRALPLSWNVKIRGRSPNFAKGMQKQLYRSMWSLQEIALSKEPSQHLPWQSFPWSRKNPSKIWLLCWFLMVFSVRDKPGNHQILHHTAVSRHKDTALSMCLVSLKNNAAGSWIKWIKESRYMRGSLTELRNSTTQLFPPLPTCCPNQISTKQFVLNLL